MVASRCTIAWAMRRAKAPRRAADMSSLYERSQVTHQDIINNDP
jgi:hypothetical protein